MTVVGMVRAVCITLGVLLLAAAATVALVPLPGPAAGGTCGPGTSSESAFLAFFNPGSIGAGPEPTAGSGQRSVWQAFVHECQSAADTRMAVAGSIAVGALFVMFGIPWAVRRFAGDDAATGLPPPGWYPDPADPSGSRWWDGRAWGPPAAPAPVPEPPVRSTADSGE